MFMSLQKRWNAQSPHKQISCSIGVVRSQGTLVCNLSKVFSLACRLSNFVKVHLSACKAIKRRVGTISHAELSEWETRWHLRYLTKTEIKWMKLQQISLNDTDAIKVVEECFIKFIERLLTLVFFRLVWVNTMKVV